MGAGSRWAKKQQQKKHQDVILCERKCLDKTDQRRKAGLVQSDRKATVIKIITPVVSRKGPQNAPSARAEHHIERLGPEQEPENTARVFRVQ